MSIITSLAIINLRMTNSIKNRLNLSWISGITRVRLSKIITTFFYCKICRKVCLFVLWPRLNDETVNETDNFSDLDPYTSPRWLVDIELDGTRKMLCESRVFFAFYLRIFTDSSMDELLDTKEMPASENKVNHYVQINPQESKMAHALSGITQSHTAETKDIGFISAQGANEEFVSSFKMIWSVYSRLIQLLFVKNVIRQIFEEPFKKGTEDFSDFQKDCFALLSRSKAAPTDSLTSRIATTLTKCLNRSNGMQLMCTMWMDIVDCLNTRWDNTENIHGLAYQ